MRVSSALIGWWASLRARLPIYPVGTAKDAAAPWARVPPATLPEAAAGLSTSWTCAVDTAAVCELTRLMVRNSGGDAIDRAARGEGRAVTADRLAAWTRVTPGRLAVLAVPVTTGIVADSAPTTSERMAAAVVVERGILYDDGVFLLGSIYCDD